MLKQTQDQHVTDSNADPEMRFVAGVGYRMEWQRIHGVVSGGGPVRINRVI